MSAKDVIATLAADIGADPERLTIEYTRRIKCGLEDGAALASLGIHDADAVESAHAMLDDYDKDPQA